MHFSIDKMAGGQIYTFSKTPLIYFVDVYKYYYIKYPLDSTVLVESVLAIKGSFVACYLFVDIFVSNKIQK